jgi:hypothetical protein
MHSNFQITDNYCLWSSCNAPQRRSITDTLYNNSGCFKTENGIRSKATVKNEILFALFAAPLGEPGR